MSLFFSPAVRNSEFSFIEDIRQQLERSSVPRYRNFFYHPLPKMLSEWSLEHATARGIDPSMVLLAFMGGISGADRGHTQIETGDGRYNNLSFLIFVSAESGSGKSSAMQPVLDAYTVFEEEESATFKKQVIRQDALRAVLQRQRQKAIKDAADTGVLELVEELSLRLNKLGMKKRVQLPRLFINDVTSSSLSEAVSRWGYANIMDPDGTSLDINTYRQIAKYWSGEGNAQLRVTRDSSIVREPFISCVVLTQPQFFRKLVLAEVQRAMGITARSLLYVCPANQIRGKGNRDVDEAFMRSFKNKLHMLLKHSAYDSEGARPSKRILQVEPEGVEALRAFHERMEYQAKCNKRVQDWCIRAAQQAYRVAGIFHLCEHDDPWALHVSTREVEMAINFMWTAYDYVVDAVSPSYDRDTLRCILKIAEWCEEHSAQMRVSNAEIKNAMRGSFLAQQVDIAISWLIDWNQLIVTHPTRHYGAGRPLGDWYLNNINSRQ